MNIEYINHAWFIPIPGESCKIDCVTGENQGVVSRNCRQCEVADISLNACIKIDKRI